MSGGGPDIKGMIINSLIHKPVQCWLGGATFLYALRMYQTKSTYNYWFGKCEFDRMVQKGKI